jgi:ABC-type phosphate transport system substrate-binding protein
MRTRTRLLIALAGVLLGAPALPAQRGNNGGGAGSYQVVVNANNPANALNARELSRIFRKEVTRWADGSAAAPVDQRQDSPTRAAFSVGVHGRSPAIIAEFWRQQIFSGRSIPPVEKSSDAEVLEFVRATPGAVGYVSSGTPLVAGVKAVTVER